MKRHSIHLQPVNRERDHNAAQRAASAYKLWIRGHNFDRIAQELGYANRSVAWKAVQRVKEAMKAPPDVEDERTRERERLEIAYTGIAQRVEDGDVWAIDRAIALSKRKSELLGLDVKRDDAPTSATIVEVAYPSAWADAFSAIESPPAMPALPASSSTATEDGNA